MTEGERGGYGGVCRGRGYGDPMVGGMWITFTYPHYKILIHT